MGRRASQQDVTFAGKSRLRVPEDVSIIGFDDVEIAEYLGLTTMRQPITEIGKAAAQRLLDRIAAKPLKGSVQFISYKTELIIRKKLPLPSNLSPLHSTGKYIQSHLLRC